MTHHYDSALQLMEMCGGQFVKSLVYCYHAADPVNKAKLRETFAGYFDVYEARFAAWQEQQREAA
jgi:hypothetical protein